MTVKLDIFDQEKVWDMALKAERREGREEGIAEGREEGRKEGFAAGMISICREMGHMEDQEIIRVLMKEMHVSRDKAAEYLAGYEASDPGGK